jgi:hypothetical protein
VTAERYAHHLPSFAKLSTQGRHSGGHDTLLVVLQLHARADRTGEEPQPRTVRRILMTAAMDLRLRAEALDEAAEAIALAAATDKAATHGQ